MCICCLFCIRAKCRISSQYSLETPVKPKQKGCLTRSFIHIQRSPVWPDSPSIKAAGSVISILRWGSDMQFLSKNFLQYSKISKHSLRKSEAFSNKHFFPCHTILLPNDSSADSKLNIEHPFKKFAFLFLSIWKKWIKYLIIWIIKGMNIRSLTSKMQTKFQSWGMCLILHYS